MDFAHTETDKQIEELEKRLQSEYRQAYKETKGKLEKYLSDFARKDEVKRKLVEKGELSKEKYKEWRTNQMLTGQRWAKMVDTLARDMNRTNQIAADIISGDLKDTFALNANFAAYGIENGFQTDFGFTLYNEDTVNRLIEENPDLLPAPRVDIPEDIRWNKQKITSNITQAVLQGKSIPEIAKTMQTVVGMNKASATRNARTAMTGAQNAGRQQAYDRAKAMGIKVKKEWIATLDGRTRHSHGMADGQQVEIDGKFTVGRAKMRYPGDVQNGTPEEIYNCRCTMATVEPPAILRGEEPRKTYDEWIAEKSGKGDKLYQGKKVQAKKVMDTPRNKYGEEIAFNFGGASDEVKGKIKDDIIYLSDMYNTGLREVQYVKKSFIGGEAGSVDVTGSVMTLHKANVTKHEFFHTLDASDRSKKSYAGQLETNEGFWKEAKKLFFKYKKETVHDNSKRISEYSTKKVDEFMAEAFSVYYGEKPADILGVGTKSPYVIQAMNIIDKYFKKEI